MSARLRQATALVLATARGDELALAPHVESGLAVTRVVDGYGWNVSHVESGRTVARGFANVEAATAALRELLKVGDWERSMEVLTGSQGGDFATRARQAREEAELKWGVE